MKLQFWMRVHLKQISFSNTKNNLSLRQNLNEKKNTQQG